MHAQIGVIFSKLHKFNVYPVYSSDDQLIRVWRDSKRSDLLYVISIDSNKFNINDKDETLLADNMEPGRVVQFIAADLGVETSKVDVHDTPMDYAGPEYAASQSISSVVEKYARNKKRDQKVAEAIERNSALGVAKKKKRKIDMEELETDDWD
jgi:hypothetical protein